MSRVLWIPLLVLAVLGALLGAGLKTDPQALPSPLIGKPAPAFRLARIDDAAQALTPRDLEGKAWVFNVWASWCASCRQEHALLLDLARKDLAPIVGLNYMDGNEPGRQWLEKHGNPYRWTVVDPRGRTGIDYGVYGVPETFVIDRQGVVRFKHAGPLTREVLDQKLIPLLEALRRG